MTLKSVVEAGHRGHGAASGSGDWKQDSPRRGGENKTDGKLVLTGRFIG